jgi:hypothetical protein
MVAVVVVCTEQRVERVSESCHVGHAPEAWRVQRGVKTVSDVSFSKSTSGTDLAYR